MEGAGHCTIAAQCNRTSVLVNIITLGNEIVQRSNIHDSYKAAMLLESEAVLPGVHTSTLDIHLSIFKI